MRFVSQKPWVGNLLAVLAGLLMAALLVGAAEGALRLKVFLSTPDRIGGTFHGGLRYGGVLGLEATPGTSLHCGVTRGGRVLYDAVCTADDAGRRWTPCAPIGPDARAALFFGCSFTHGVGVADEETLPARYCVHAGNVEALNYGFSAYGPQQTWLQICKLNALEPFRGRGGIVVYTFIDDHIPRLIGTPEVVSSWPFTLPWLELEDGHVVHRGFFSDRNPLQYYYLRYVRALHLCRFVENHVPRRPAPPPSREKAVDFLSRLLLECAEKTAETSPELTFCVLIFPESAGAWGADLAERLKKSPIRVLDYQTLFSAREGGVESLFFEDNPVYRLGHPTAEAYDLVARQLALDTAVKAAP